VTFQELSPAELHLLLLPLCLSRLNSTDYLSESSNSHNHSHGQTHSNFLANVKPLQSVLSTMGGGNKPPSSSQETGYPQLNFTPKGAQIRDIYQGRIKNFTAKGQYEDVNLWSMVELDCESGKEYVTLEVYSVPELKRPTFEEAIQGLFPTALWLESPGTHLG
jgi:hypothetical protein